MAKEGIILKMKKIYLWRCLMGVSIALLVVAAFFWGYSKNTFGIQDYMTKRAMSARVVRLVNEQKISPTKRMKIEKLVMKQTHKNLQKQGFISIPSLGILLPIFDSAYTNYGLNQGANYANRTSTDPKGHHIPVIGEGNYGIAAHNFADGKTAFSRLQEHLNKNEPYITDGQMYGSSWLNGRYVYMANDTGVYVYQIVQQKTVDQTNLAVLNQSRNAQLTILTCLNPDDTYRIATIASLRKTYTWQSAPDKLVNYFDLTKQPTNAHANWYNPGEEEGSN